MKKIRLISILLCFVITCSAFIGVIDKIISIAKAENLESSYWELSADLLHEYSTNTSYVDATPKITVFTHGCGGSASHWSNNSNYKFAK